MSEKKAKYAVSTDTAYMDKANAHGWAFEARQGDNMRWVAYGRHGHYRTEHAADTVLDALAGAAQKALQITAEIEFQKNYEVALHVQRRDAEEAAGGAIMREIGERSRPHPDKRPGYHSE